MGSYLYVVVKPEKGAIFKGEPIYFSKYLYKPSYSRDNPAWVSAAIGRAEKYHGGKVKYLVSHTPEINDNKFWSPSNILQRIDGGISDVFPVVFNDDHFADRKNYWKIVGTIARISKNKFEIKEIPS